MQQGLESKKQQYKVYLQETGALQKISQIFSKLFQQPQKPSNTLDYMLQYLGIQSQDNVHAILEEYEKEQLENIKLRAQIKRIKKQIDQEKGI